MQRGFSPVSPSSSFSPVQNLGRTSRRSESRSSGSKSLPVYERMYSYVYDSRHGKMVYMALTVALLVVILYTQYLQYKNFTDEELSQRGDAKYVRYIRDYPYFFHGLVVLFVIMLIPSLVAINRQCDFSTRH